MYTNIKVMQPYDKKNQRPYTVLIANMDEKNAGIFDDVIWNDVIKPDKVPITQTTK